MPRFVILEHDHPTLHWDFMLEAGTALKTWRLAKAPATEGESIAAEPLGDHRIAYLDYEGPVSGGRGEVRRWDRGDYELLSDMNGPAVQIMLSGQRLMGMAVLRKMDAMWSFQIGDAST